MCTYNSWEAFWKDAEAKSSGYVFAQCTDMLIFERWPDGKNAVSVAKDRIMDIRIFDTDYECHLFRTDIGPDAAWLGRMKDGDSWPLPEDKDRIKNPDMFDEYQMIDIDAPASINQPNGYAQAIGGGVYPLPHKIEDGLKIIIRNYVGYYEESGQAYVKDWRLVGFTTEEK